MYRIRKQYTGIDDKVSAYRRLKYVQSQLVQFSMDERNTMRQCPNIVTGSYNDALMMGVQYTYHTGEVLKSVAYLEYNFVSNLDSVDLINLPDEAHYHRLIGYVSVLRSIQSACTRMHLLDTDKLGKEYVKTLDLANEIISGFNLAYGFRFQLLRLEY